MWTTPMMRLGNVFIGIRGEAMNPLLASETFREFVSKDVTTLTDAMLHQLQNDAALKAAIVEELGEVKNGAFGVHFVGHEPFRQWIWPWSTNIENEKSDSLMFAPEKENKTLWECKPQDIAESRATFSAGLSDILARRRLRYPDTPRGGTRRCAAARALQL